MQYRDVAFVDDRGDRLRNQMETSGRRPSNIGQLKVLISPRERGPISNALGACLMFLINAHFPPVGAEQMRLPRKVETAARTE